MVTEVAIGYTRLSQKSDASIDDQKQEIRDLADEQGFNLTRIYDDGELASGFDSERPEYLQMQTDLEDGLADVLIVRGRDRLSRDKRERSMLMYDIGDWGIELWTTTDRARIELNSDEAWLIEMIQAYIDDVAKRREIQRARTKIQQRVDAGFHQGRPRYGTKFDEQREHLVPGDNFGEVITAIEMREAGESFRSIVEQTAIPSTSTLSRILEREDWYHALAKESRA
ncbi:MULTISPECIES: recombinase family protein [Halorubrum]|nr:MULTISPECIES: recombinase family protein [Halorubrum]